MVERKYSEEFDLAVKFAAVIHSSQNRKNSHIPYITHPFHVAMILSRFGYSKEIVIAGVLHDVIEDADFSNKEIVNGLFESFQFFSENSKKKSSEEMSELLVPFLIETFGIKVLELVESVTFFKSDHKNKTWRQRKELQLKKMDKASKDTARLKGADTLHNLESLCMGVVSDGLISFKKFNSENGEDDVPWYYCQSAARISGILGEDDPLVKELKNATKRLIAMIDKAKTIK